MPLVLNGLDLHIKAREAVAFVGPSGGGKTMLMKLLLRLYDPLCGCILIDNHKIQNIWLESLRSHVGLVSQDRMSNCQLRYVISAYFLFVNLDMGCMYVFILKLFIVVHNLLLVLLLFFLLVLGIRCSQLLLMGANFHVF